MTSLAYISNSSKNIPSLSAICQYYDPSKSAKKPYIGGFARFEHTFFKFALNYTKDDRKGVTWPSLVPAFIRRLKIFSKSSTPQLRAISKSIYRNLINDNVCWLLVPIRTLSHNEKITVPQRVVYSRGKSQICNPNLPWKSTKMANTSSALRVSKTQ